MPNHFVPWLSTCSIERVSVSESQGHPSTVEQAFFQQFCQLVVQEDFPLVIYWCLADYPDQLSSCSQHLKISNSETVFQQAAEAAQHGRIPVVCLAAAAVPEVVAQICSGIEHPLILLVLHSGLYFNTRESVLHPGRYRDLTYLRTVPGLIVSAPADELDAMNLVEIALQSQSTLAIRVPGTAWVPVRRDYQDVPAGRSISLREGNDVRIVASGSMVLPALLAAESLVTWGYEAQVISARFVRPIDPALVETLLASDGSYSRPILTVEEHCHQGGLHTAVLEALSARVNSPKSPLAQWTWPKIAGLGLPTHPPIPIGSGLEQYHLDAEGIWHAALRLLGASRPEWANPENSG